MKAYHLPILLAALIAVAATGCRSVYVTSARVYMQQNELDQAKEQLKLGLEQNPKDAEAHYLLGEIYSQELNYPEMLKEFETSLALNQKHAKDVEGYKDKHFKNLYNQAVESFNNKKYEEAITNLQSATLIRPEAKEAWSLLGKAYVSQKDYPSALESLKKAIAADPKFERLDDRILLMDIYYNTTQLEQALNAAEEILRKDPAQSDAIRVAAFCYNQLALKEPDATTKSALQNKALGYYEKVMVTQPDNPDMIYNLGLLYEAMGRDEEALNQFVKTIEKNPQDMEAIKHIAMIYHEKEKDYLKAIEYYKMALNLEPNNVGVWTNLAIAQFKAASEAKDEATRKKLNDESTASYKKVKELSGQK